MKYSIVILINLIGSGLFGQVETEINPDVWTIGSTVVINGAGTANGGQILLKDSLGTNKVRIFSSINTTTNPGGFIDLYNEDGLQAITISGHDTHKGGRIQMKDSLGVNRLILNTNYSGTGDSRVITDEIEIKGGSDLAELFDITDPVDDIMPGLLVSLDPDHPGKLKLSNTSYDPKVAGVLSGANGVKPGILMGQDETIATGDELVTLSGRTYVMANDTNGSIKVGDLITTSAIAGQAMKATKKKKSRGAVIGKAMTELEKGTGYILVLINLQ